MIPVSIVLQLSHFHHNVLVSVALYEELHSVFSTDIVSKRQRESHDDKQLMFKVLD